MKSDEFGRLRREPEPGQGYCSIVYALTSVASLRRLAGPALPPAAVLRQHRGQKLAGVAARRLDDVFGRAPGDDLAAAVAAFGAEVDHPVRGFYDLEVVLDHD